MTDGKVEVSSVKRTYASIETPVKTRVTSDHILKETKEGFEVVERRWYHHIFKRFPSITGIYGARDIEGLVDKTLKSIPKSKSSYTSKAQSLSVALKQLSVGRNYSKKNIFTIFGKSIPSPHEIKKIILDSASKIDEKLSSGNQNQPS